MALKAARLFFCDICVINERYWPAVELFLLFVSLLSFLCKNCLVSVIQS